jgi:hypothetical protein
MILIYIWREVLPIYPKLLTDKLILNFNNNLNIIKNELSENIKSQGVFSLTLDTWYYYVLASPGVVLCTV